MSELFVADAKKLVRKGSISEQQLAKFLNLIAANPRHPSLRSEKLARANHIWASSLSMQYRVTWQWLEGDSILLRAIGDHDPTLNKG
jgi:mRNA-degrading endonuclease YafQ of YafQ-DinJ toxin-antitoxin module